MRYYRQNTAVGAYLGASDSFWLQQTTYLGHVSPSGASAFITFVESIFRFPALDFTLIPRVCHFRQLYVTFVNSLDPDQARLFVGPDLDINCLAIRSIIFRFIYLSIYLLICLFCLCFWELLLFS